MVDFAFGCGFVVGVGAIAHVDFGVVRLGDLIVFVGMVGGLLVFAVVCRFVAWVWVCLLLVAFDSMFAGFGFVFVWVFVLLVCI